MKKIYIKPLCEEVKLFFEAELCAPSTTTTAGSLDGEHFSGGNNNIDTNEDGPDVMHAKQGDFFEEPISSSSLWGDDE
jgi:hypothetical protein